MNRPAIHNDAVTAPTTQLAAVGQLRRNDRRMRFTSLIVSTVCGAASLILPAILAIVSLSTVAAAQVVPSAIPATCGFVIDSTGHANTAATTADGGLTGSGLIFIRQALGITGSNLIAGTHIDQTPANASAVLSAISSHMTSFSQAHDVDGSGPPIGINDAVIISRYLAGFRGDALVQGLTLTGTRQTGTAIETYITNGCPPPANSNQPLTCTLTGPAIIPQNSVGYFDVACTSNGNAVAGLGYTWTPGSLLGTASGCTTTDANCTVRGNTAGETTISVQATKSGYLTANASLATRVSGNVLTITALTPKDVLLPPTQARPTISASYSNSIPSVSINTASVRLFVDGVDVTNTSTVTATGVSYTPGADLAVGPHTLYVSVDNSENLTAQAVWGFEVDLAATYDLAITTPATDGGTVKSAALEFVARASANKTYANRVSFVNSSNGRSVEAQIRYVTGGTPPNTTSTPEWFATVPLKAGNNSITATATFADGQTRTATRTVTYDAPPVVVFTFPSDHSAFGPDPASPSSPRNLTGVVERAVTLRGRVSKPLASLTAFSINQQAATLSVDPNDAGSTLFQFANFFLREGTNLVTATAVDSGGQVGSASLTLYVDQTAPVLTIEAPVNTALAGLALPAGVSVSTAVAQNPLLSSNQSQALTSNASVDVRGIVNDAVEAGLNPPYPTVSVRNASTGQSFTGKVSDRFFIVEDVALDVGVNELTVTATDWLGNARSQSFTVSRVVVGTPRITLAGGNRQRGALNTELGKPLIVTAIDAAGLPLANVPLSFEVLRGTGSINPAISTSVTSTVGTGSGTITTVIPNALTGQGLPAVKPDGVNPARRLTVSTDAFGRAAVWFTLGRQSGEGGNMVQVSAAERNAAVAANASNAGNEASPTLTEAVVFTATGERGLPGKILAEGNGAQYAETGGQPLEALTAITYDGESNPVPDALVAYVIEQDGGVDVADGALFPTNAPNTLAVSSNRRVLITRADNNGRSAARPTMGTATATVRVSAWAFPVGTPGASALAETLASGSVPANAVGLASFQIAVLPQSDGPTQLTGKVLDHTGKPLAGVRLNVSRTPLTVTTDANGDFLFAQDVPPGKLDLFVDGRNVTGTTPLPGNQSSPTQYPSIHFEALAIRGQKNQLPHPIYLPPLLMSEARIVGGDTDVVLKIPGYEGYEMIVKANSVTFPDGSRVGPLVVSPMHLDRLPMFPPDGWNRLLAPAATLQPSGTRFDPPVELRLPNNLGLKPGDRSKLYQWDQDLAQFVAMGWMTVSEDGAQLITEPGSGLTKAGWHVGGQNPPACPDQAANMKCTDCERSETTVVNGCPQTRCIPKSTNDLQELVIDIPTAAGTVAVISDSESATSALAQLRTTGLTNSPKIWSIKSSSTTPYNVGQTSRGGTPLACESSCNSLSPQTGSNFIVQRQNCMLSGVPGELISGQAKATITACGGNARAERDFRIRDQNPAPEVVVAYIQALGLTPSQTNAVRGFACHESGIRYGHFRADGFPVPNGAGDGGFGMMQVTDISRASCQTLWDWRINARVGADIFVRDKIQNARTKINTEGTILSGTFSNPQLVACLQRTKQKWTTLVAGGNIPRLDEDQVVREAVRGYNGGREYKWELTNAAESTDCSLGRWVISPRTTQNINYVNQVLQCQ